MSFTTEAGGNRAPTPPNVITGEITEGCDPNCEWFTACNQLNDAGQQISRAIEKMHGTEEEAAVVRLSATGHRQREALNQEYRGSDVLVQIGKVCAKKCAIQHYATSYRRPNFGSRVQILISELE